MKTNILFPLKFHLLKELDNFLNKINVKGRIIAKAKIGFQTGAYVLKRSSRGVVNPEPWFISQILKTKDAKINPYEKIFTSL